MIRQYSEATLEAYHNGVRPLTKFGLVNGSMFGSFILLYAVLTLYGAHLMYTDAKNDRCDLSGAVLKDLMQTCASNGVAFFGAMLGAANGRRARRPWSPSIGSWARERPG